MEWTKVTETLVQFHKRNICNSIAKTHRFAYKHLIAFLTVEFVLVDIFEIT